MKPWLDDRIASNGRTIKENFSAWFGKSKLVDASGEPLRLFHGTTKSFDAFEPDRCRKISMTGAEPRAVFLSTLPEVAASYAGQRTPDVDTHLPTEALYDEWLSLLKKHGPTGPSREFHRKHAVPTVPTYADGGNLVPVYVSAAKVLKINARGGNWNEICWKGDDWDTNHLIHHARDQGYEAVVIKNIHDRAEGKGAASTVCAVFDGRKIKSAIANSGLYLKDNASLTDFEADLKLRQALSAKTVANTRKRSLHEALGR